jgi:hypothetical protein
MRLPPFYSLQENYDIDPDYRAVKARIGGEVTESWLGNNTCAMRLSKSLNYAGKAYRIKKGYGMETVPGADGLNYGFKVAQLKNYLNRLYGHPKVIEKGTKINQNDFLYKQGIIALDVSGWDNATGHFSLWDGTKLLYGDEFTLPTSLPPGLKKATVLVRVSLWECP